MQKIAEMLDELVRRKARAAENYADWDEVFGMTWRIRIASLTH